MKLKSTIFTACLTFFCVQTIIATPPANTPPGGDAGANLGGTPKAADAANPAGAGATPAAAGDQAGGKATASANILKLSPENFQLSDKGGAPATVQISLSQKPSGKVQVSFVAESYEVDKCQLNFDETNWSVAQTVTVTSSTLAHTEGTATGKLSATIYMSNGQTCDKKTQEITINHEVQSALFCQITGDPHGTCGNAPSLTGTAAGGAAGNGAAGAAGANAAGANGAQGAAQSQGKCYTFDKTGATGGATGAAGAKGAAGGSTSSAGKTMTLIETADFAVQTQTSFCGGAAGCMTKMALRCGDEILILKSGNGAIGIIEHVPGKSGSQLTHTEHGAVSDIKCSNGAHFSVTTSSAPFNGVDYFNIDITAPKSTSSTGFCANPSEDTASFETKADSDMFVCKNTCSGLTKTGGNAQGGASNSKCHVDDNYQPPFCTDNTPPPPNTPPPNTPPNTPPPPSTFTQPPPPNYTQRKDECQIKEVPIGEIPPGKDAASYCKEVTAKFAALVGNGMINSFCEMDVPHSDNPKGAIQTLFNHLQNTASQTCTREVNTKVTNTTITSEVVVKFMEKFDLKVGSRVETFHYDVTTGKLTPPPYHNPPVCRPRRVKQKSSNCCCN